MKTLNEILDNYKDYAVVLDDRFGSRLAKFLTEEQPNVLRGTKVESSSRRGLRELS